MQMVRLDQNTTRVALLSEATNRMTGIEYCLSDNIDGAPELALVTVVPELQVTLATRNITCLR